MSVTIEEQLRVAVEQHRRLLEGAERTHAQGGTADAVRLFESAQAILSAVSKVYSYLEALQPYAGPGATLKEAAQRARDAGDPRAAAALDELAALLLRPT